MRYGVSLTMPTPQGWPLSTLTVNIVGTFVLALLLDLLASRGPETPRLRALRLTLGTGICGGFTTYSMFALDIASLITNGQASLAAAYVGATLIGGALAALLGIAAASAIVTATARTGRANGTGRADGKGPQ
jgi:CrcB protein